MCSICKSILTGFSVKHDEDSCPLRKSMYCPSCAVYGHLPENCPDKPKQSAIKPCYVEQLIHHSIRKEYKITTRTHIATYPEDTAEDDESNILELCNSDMVIREYLKNHGIPIASKSEIRPKMAEYAKKNNLRVYYIPATIAENGHKKTASTSK